MQQSDMFFSILGSLPLESIKQLSQTPVICECIFTQELDCQDEDEFIDAQNPYILQIRGDFLVECEPRGKNIIGGVLLGLDYKFEIKRYCLDPESQFGKPYAFVFYFPEKDEHEEQMALKLGMRSEGADDLENFAKCLESKPIFQVGLHDNFKVIQRLFCSSSAALYSAIQLRSGKQVAIKCIRKDLFLQLNRDLKKGMNREYVIPLSFDSPYICKYSGAFESDTSVYIVMERFSVNFLQFLQMKLLRSYDQLRQIFKKICIAVSKLHQKGIMHRDIKPENIMMRKISQDCYDPVLIDFGLAQYDGILPYVFVKCGTPGYLAPQIQSSSSIEPQYGRSCDVFSLGCLFHFLMLRKPLFEGNTFMQVIEKNKKCEISFESQIYKSLAKQALDLLKKMLEKDPKERISVSDIIEHEYLESKGEVSTEKEQSNTINEIVFKQQIQN